MTITKDDLAILNRLNFNIPPVGVKYLTQRPNNIDRLSDHMTLCEMLKKAQGGEVFYADTENHTCDAGLYVLGQVDLKEPYINGEFGTGHKLFEAPRSASRLYLYTPKIAKGVVKYIAFSPQNKLPFEPDILILLTVANQTEIILRAMSYQTGQMWKSNYAAAIGCAWIFVYPYLTGELNYTITGLGIGMKRRKLFPEGMQFIAIPFDLMPSIIQSLKDMPWVLPAYEPDGQEYVRKMRIELGLDSPQKI
jgi:uncharacterized protein (DUF169 family)